MICLGYKGYMIKEYFANYYLHNCDVIVRSQLRDLEVHRSGAEPWRVTLVDTGESTMTGGRLRRVLPMSDGEEFCFTYGDGVTDLDIGALVVVPPGSGAAGHRDRRPAAGPLRRDSDRRSAWRQALRRSRLATVAG